MFKNSTRLANWDTINKKIIFNAPPQNLEISLFSQYSIGSYYDGSNTGFFSYDGTNYFSKLYSNVIKRYSVSVPFDVTSIGNLEQTYNLPITGLSRCCIMSDNGLKLYVTYILDNVCYLKQLDLTVAWDLNSTVDNGKEINFGESDLLDMCFNTDGSRLFIFNYNYLEIYEYSLLSNYEITGMSLLKTVYVYYLIDDEIQNIAFTRDGKSLLLLNNNYPFDYTSYIYQCNLSTDWDIYSAGYYSTLSLSGALNGIYFKPGNEYIFYNFTAYPKEYRIDSTKSVVSNRFVANYLGESNEYKYVTVYINGIDIDNLDFYIGEYYNPTYIIYTEIPTTGNTTYRQSQRIGLTNTNRYGLNWKAIGAEGSEITRLLIKYEKE